MAPVDAGQTSKVGGERALALPLMRRNASLGFRDLLPQLGYCGRHLSAPGDFARRKTRGFEGLQRFAVFLELHPVPRNPTIAVCNHDPDFLIRDQPIIAWKPKGGSVACRMADDCG
jgi:hypothetical protein